jgi:hypothetical protein
VIPESLFHGESGHTNVKARLCRVATRVKPKHGTVGGSSGIEQDHVDAVVEIFGSSHGPAISVAQV